MREGDVAANGIRLRYLDWGGDGPPVLCIHGITANAHAFAPLANHLGDEHRVVAIDLRGRGGSDKPEEGYDIGTHVEDVAGVLEGLELAPAAVVGWSLGAKIALGLAALRPELVERVVAIDPPVETPAASIAVLRAFWERLDRTYPSVDAFIAGMRESWSFTPWSAAVEGYLRGDVEETPDGTARHRVRRRVPEAELEAESRYPTRSFYAGIRCPVLVLRAPLPLVRAGDQVLGEQDARELERALADARVVDVEGANHFSIVFDESSPAFATIASFLAERAAP